MFYLDTSLLVAVFTQEEASGRATGWLRQSRSEGFAISEWVATEFAAALAAKIRMKRIDESFFADALALFAKMAAEWMQVAAISEAHFKKAAQYASDYRLGLRAGDALHLAVASDNHAILCTLDKRMAGAAKALGLPRRLV